MIKLAQMMIFKQIEINTLADVFLGDFRSQTKSKIYQFKKMFLGLGQARDRDQNIGTCWPQLEVIFKFLMVLSMVLILLTYLLAVFDYFPLAVTEVVDNYQLWRLISSILLPSIGMWKVINTLFQWLILYQFMPDIEKKFSSAYMLFEVLMQTFLCNFCTLLIGYPLAYFKVGGDSTYSNFGMYSVIFTLIWLKVADHPQQPTRFWCCPCLVPTKYIPLIFFFLLAIFGYPIVPLAISISLGYYQFMVRKKAILRLPLKIYRKFDSCIPDSLKNNPGYIKVKDVQSCLRKVCLEGGCCTCCDADEEEHVFEGNANPKGNKDRVEVLGGGVAIGGSSEKYVPQNDFKGVWKDREVNQNQNERPPLESDDKFEENMKKINKKQEDEDFQFDNKSVVSDKPLQEEKPN